jgi:hypothetical protein
VPARTAQPAGYQLMLVPELIDVFRFEQLAAQGHAELRGDPVRAAAPLREALLQAAGRRGAALAAYDQEGRAACLGGRAAGRRAWTGRTGWPASTGGCPHRAGQQRGSH